MKDTYKPLLCFINKRSGKLVELYRWSKDSSQQIPGSLENLDTFNVCTLFFRSVFVRGERENGSSTAKWPKNKTCKYEGKISQGYFRKVVIDCIFD